MFYQSEKQTKLVNIIKKFGCIKINQLKHISKIENADKLLESILSSWDAPIKKQDDIFFDSKLNKINTNMLKALDVFSCICSHLTISWYEKASFPYLISFIQNNKLYDITVIPSGQEGIMMSLLNRSDSDRIIIVVDSRKQVEKIKLTNKHYKILALDK